MGEGRWRMWRVRDKELGGRGAEEIHYDGK